MKVDFWYYISICFLNETLINEGHIYIRTQVWKWKVFQVNYRDNSIQIKFIIKEGDEIKKHKKFKINSPPEKTKGKRKKEERKIWESDKGGMKKKRKNERKRTERNKNREKDK